jgi:hypothetical protein
MHRIRHVTWGPHSCFNYGNTLGGNQQVDVFAPQSTYIGRDETGSVYLPTQLERTLQLYW